MRRMTSPFSQISPDLLKLVGAEDGVFPPEQAVYTNRDLALSGIKLVGFDMDYTLAIYQKAPMEQLQYDLTVDRLVSLGYPQEIKELKYDPDAVIRGLVVDKRTGNVLKMDTHGRVARAWHGHRRLSHDEVQSHYQHARLKLGSESLASADTLFSMPEVNLYQNLIAFFDERQHKGESTAPLTLPPDTPRDRLLSTLNTWKLYDDVREGIDSIHRDDSLKNIIMGALDKYFVLDDKLPVTLHKLRSAGKKLFLLTNSYWRYTDAVMSYLLDGRLNEYATWRSYFDVIICGGKKPNFFTERRPFLEVLAQKGVEQTIGEVDADRFDSKRVYQGGNIADFERMVSCKGEEILYVGDHIFGDIVRSRRDSRWRTCLVVEELEDEIKGSLKNKETAATLDEVDEKRYVLDEEIAVHRFLLDRFDSALNGKDVCIVDDKQKAEIEEAAKRLKKEIDVAKRSLRSLDKEAYAHQDELDKDFNGLWGRLFKASNELSRFGAQVELYACCYTAKVSNFRHYSPMHFFRAPRERMSHDAALASTDRKKAARSRTHAG